MLLSWIVLISMMKKLKNLLSSFSIRMQNTFQNFNAISAKTLLKTGSVCSAKPLDALDMLQVTWSNTTSQLSIRLLWAFLMDHFGATIAKVILTQPNWDMQELNLANLSLPKILQNWLKKKSKFWKNFNNWPSNKNKKCTNLRNLSKDWKIRNTRKLLS